MKEHSLKQLQNAVNYVHSHSFVVQHFVSTSHTLLSCTIRFSKKSRGVEDSPDCLDGGDKACCWILSRDFPLGSRGAILLRDFFWVGEEASWLISVEKNSSSDCRTCCCTPAFYTSQTESITTFTDWGGRSITALKSVIDANFYIQIKVNNVRWYPRYLEL